MFQQNTNKWFFVYVTNSRNIIHVFPKKIISHNPLQKVYPNFARTCKNKFYENKIKLNLQSELSVSVKENSDRKKKNLLKKTITVQLIGGQTPRLPSQIGLTHQF